ncbi:FKBP-type peptidyl-prolyl cis-trans isomerase [Candidatus Dependentiae bacterium]|nr:FKBP-type peptidyl-prolyl cis-trans isomerase [Candidatus Dependentiae bacterium]MBU4387202.1 FKBP-type peptidyl-prolyl cis-trans isomerase [Candidatus Dependentiae bacterium]MCG2756035.1 FKBP-type peptidyl-prolyl cis-trans isomerase [Candidatus Dependentiae bacterium]
MKKNSFLILTISSGLILFQACTNNNKIEANKNINNNLAKNEVNMITTESGLKYEILTPGKTEQTPKRGQHVTVHYTGWLDNNGEVGKKFDSSVDRNEPFTFVLGVGMVIRGWDEGVASMKLGEKRRLTIPSNLGYGPRGAGNVIPGNATLIFEVELLKIG